MKSWLSSVLMWCLVPWWTVSAETNTVSTSTNALLSKSSLTIEESLDYAVRHNTQVLKAKEEIRRTYGVILETRGEMLPQLTGRASLLKTEPQTTEFFTNTQTFDGTLRLSQVIYAGGQIWGSTKIAYLNRQVAVFQFERIVADTILAVRSRFYDVLYNDQLIRVREASIHYLEEQLQTVKRRFEAGTVPKFDVLQAEVALANARPPLIQAQNDFRIAKLRLANLMALNTHMENVEAFPYVLIGELQYSPYDPGLSESIGTGLKRRVEIKETEKLVEARKEGVHVSYSGYKPRLEIYGQFGGHSPSLGDSKQLVVGGVTNSVRGSTSDLDPTVSGWSAGAQLTWDVFDGFSTHGRVNQAKALLDSAKQDLEEKKREVGLEVRGAYSRLQEAREVLESQKKVLEQAEEGLRLSQARFSVGAGTQLDVLQSQTALTDARTTHARALFEWNVAVATLERNMGINTRIADLDELRKQP
jgi:outer membrane protein TolC